MNSVFKEYNSREEARGAEHAHRRKSAELAAFVVNINKPTENPRHKDLRDVEDYLHGYYGEWISDLKLQIAELESRNRNLQARAEKAEEVLDAYKSRQSRPKSRRAATRANR